MFEPHRVGGAKRVGVEVADHFKDSGAESFPGFGIGMLAAILSDTERSADMANHRLWHCHQIPLATTHPVERFLVGGGLTSHAVYPISGILFQSGHLAEII